MKLLIHQPSIKRLITFTYKTCEKMSIEAKFPTKYFLSVFLILVSGAVFSQNALNPDYLAYIDRYKTIAVEEMVEYRIPASITLAQGLLESNCGKSPLATEANNHFGIKCHKDWTGETFFYDDDEKQECFRKYTNADSSFRDHSLFLKNRKRYEALFSLDSDDYTGWAMGLKQAGYATNPDYPKLLIRIIENYRLDRFDHPGANVPVEEEMVAKFKQPDLSLKSDILSKNGSLLFKSGYTYPGSQQFEVLRKTSSGRTVYTNNGIPLILAGKEDTWTSLAKEFLVYSSQLARENDMDKDDPIQPGQIIYLEPKKKSSPAMKHLVKENETLYSIAQFYGIKLKYLSKFNQLNPDEEPKKGSTLILGKEHGLFF